ncbi:MAG: hypothetical protein WCK67_02495 [bacterium]
MLNVMPFTLSSLNAVAKKTLVSKNTQINTNNNNNNSAALIANLAILAISNKSFIRFTSNSENDPPLINMLKTGQLNKEESSKTIKEILNDPQKSYKFIEVLTQNPRKLNTNLQILENSIESSRTYELVYNDYVNAFSNFIKKFYEKAESAEELLKFSPNWKTDKLVAKYEEKNGDRNLKIGKIPETFGSQETFTQLVTELKTGVKKTEEKEINGTNFQIKKLSGGKTRKGIFKITNGDNKFILKFEEPNEYAKTLKAQMELPDTIATNAMIDYYLTANNCPNSSKIYYYDSKLNASLYENVESDEDEEYRQEKLSDYTELGMFFNDTLGYKNIIMSNHTPVIIDAGHSTFSNALKPMAPEFTRNLPNNIGQSF